MKSTKQNTSSSEDSTETRSKTGNSPDKGRMRLIAMLDHALDGLRDVDANGRRSYQTQVYQLAETLMGSDAGMQALYRRAPEFDERHLFEGGPWHDVGALRPALVRGSLDATGAEPILESLSQLRMLARATGAAGVDPEQARAARAFLEGVLALNLDLVVAGLDDTVQPKSPTEASTVDPRRRATHRRLFSFIAHEVGTENLEGILANELEQCRALRAITTANTLRLIERARSALQSASSSSSSSSGAELPARARLVDFIQAIDAPTALSRTTRDLDDYQRQVEARSESELAREADELATSMARTGLVAPHHALALRAIATRAPQLIPNALGLGRAATVEYGRNPALVAQLIDVAIHTATAQSIYGLSRVLERRLLCSVEIASGFEELLRVELHPRTRAQLDAHPRTESFGLIAGIDPGLSSRELLVAATLSVLGQPLGISQGRNPSCQAARGISMWSQRTPARIATMLVALARDGSVEIPFAQTVLRSADLPAREFDPTGLDCASALLMPHIDRIYAAMLELVAGRTRDGHEWVNPALYGAWVPLGFSSIFADGTAMTVTGHEDHVRRFFAAYHPDYRAASRPRLPLPVGACVCDQQGQYLGPHAITLQRIATDARGDVRVYFFNPNQEASSAWAPGVLPTAMGHGERHGENSLPFGEFAAHMYGFHYDAHDCGDPARIPPALVRGVETRAKTSWGRAFTWLDGTTQRDGRPPNSSAAARPRSNVGVTG